MNILNPIKPHMPTISFLMHPPFNYTREQAESIIDRQPLITKRNEKSILKIFEALQTNFPLWAKKYFLDRPNVIGYSPKTLIKRFDAFTQKKEKNSGAEQRFIDTMIPSWLHNIYYKGSKKAVLKTPKRKVVDRFAEAQIGLEELGFSRTEIVNIISRMRFENPHFIEEFKHFESFMSDCNIKPTEYSRERVIISLASTRWEAFKKPLDFFVKNKAGSTAIKNFISPIQYRIPNYSEREMYAILNYMAYMGRDISNNYLGGSAYTYFRKNNITMEEVVAKYGPKEGREVPKIKFKNYAEDVFFEVFETEGFSKEQAAKLWQKHGDVFNTGGQASNRFAITESIELLKGKGLTTDEIFECYLKNKVIMMNNSRLLKPRLDLIDELSAILERDVLRQLLQDNYVKLLNKKHIANVKMCIEINSDKKNAAAIQLLKFAHKYIKESQAAASKRFSIYDTGNKRKNAKIKKSGTISFNITERR